MDKRLNDLVILIRGAGEMATGVAHRLASCHFKVCMTETSNPQAVRREVAFSETIFDHEKEVEGVTAKKIDSPHHILQVWSERKIPILIDPEAKVKDFMKPDVLIDATLAKKNLGTKITDAPLVIGLGPGFHAGKGVHLVIETNRGHNLGRIMFDGEAEPNTGIPGDIGGYTEERVIRAPKDGKFNALRKIGDGVQVNGKVGIIENNGPCGGSTNGKCEVDRETDCAWQLIIDRLKELGQLDRYEEIIPIKDWTTARDGGPRKRVREDLRL